MKRFVCAFAAAAFLFVTGCSTTGTLGIVTKSMADPTSLLKSPRPFQELGSVEGRACRYFAIGVIPWGASDMQTAVDKALSEKGGDALINVSVESSLYGFIPIYHVFDFTCTTVKGIAIKWQ
jgi:hypothetical protein